MAKLVALLACYGSSLGSNPDIFQKHKMGNISKGAGQLTLARPQKNIQKINETGVLPR